MEQYSKFQFLVVRLEEKLRSLYNAFKHMAKDMSKVKEMTQEMIDKLTILN